MDYVHCCEGRASPPHVEPIPEPPEIPEMVIEPPVEIAAVEKTGVIYQWTEQCDEKLLAVGLGVMFFDGEVPVRGDAFSRRVRLLHPSRRTPDARAGRGLAATQRVTAAARRAAMLLISTPALKAHELELHVTRPRALP